MCGIAVLFLVAPLPVRRMGNRWMDDEQKDGWGTDGRMANKQVKQRVGRQIDGWGLANRQMDGEQKDGKQKVGRQIDRWGLANRWTDGEHKDGW